MTLRTMVFPPFAASTDSIRVSLVVVVLASAARLGRDGAEHGTPLKVVLHRLWVGSLLVKLMFAAGRCRQQQSQ